MKRIDTGAAPGTGRVLWILNATSFSVGMWAASLGPALPALAQRMGIGLDEAGILFTADSLGYLACVSIVGRALDVGNRQALLLSSLVLMAVGMTLLPLVPALPLALGLVLIIGLGEGTLITGGSVIAGDLQPHRQAAAINVQQAFFAGGALVAPLVIGYALSHLGSVHYAFWLIGLLIALLVMFLFLIPIPQSSSDARSVRSAWRSLLSQRPFWLLLIFVLIYVGAGVGFTGWIFTYVRYGLGASDAWAAATTSVFWAALALGRALSAQLLRRLAAIELLVLATFGAILGAAFLMIGLTPLLTAVGTLILGLFYGPLIPTAMGMAHASYPKSAGTAIGLLNAATAIGWMTIPWLEGKLIVTSGFGTLMAITLVANVILFGFALSLRRHWEPGR